MTPEEFKELRRQDARQAIQTMGLKMTTKPNGLIHIHGRGLDITVRDLASLQESDFREAW
ncbi:hypothetical protein [Stutzerimonas stutzeri]|uniref:hypothetical protein n=1 Tax=Stutzerimonas TaxID=2901164 RepID=UPI001BB0B480|nr:hypothetical protein [Stutzerimonas stutzeri]QUE74386.1 hypothetical protein KCX70_13960 [Stutzerimonas stutzeri]